MKTKNQTMTNQPMTMHLFLTYTNTTIKQESLSKYPPPPPPQKILSDGEQCQRSCWYQSESAPVTRSSEHRLHPQPSSSIVPAHAGIQNIQFRSPSRRSRRVYVQRVDNPVSPHRSKTAQQFEITTDTWKSCLSKSADKQTDPLVTIQPAYSVLTVSSHKKNKIRVDGVSASVLPQANLILKEGMK